jgi:hypothetical protein
MVACSRSPASNVFLGEAVLMIVYVIHLDQAVVAMVPYGWHDLGGFIIPLTGLRDGKVTAGKGLHTANS